jgi:hypothetical protein
MRAFDEDWRPSVEGVARGLYWTPGEGLVRFATAVPLEEDLEPIDGSSEPGARIPDEILQKVRDRLVRPSSGR